MSVFASAQNMVMLVISVAVFAMMVVALVDCVRTRPDAFVAAGKRTKNFWLVVTGLAVLIGFVHVGRPFGIINLVAIVGAAVYLTDVRPAVRSLRGTGDQRRMGPYGPW